MKKGALGFLVAALHFTVFSQGVITFNTEEGFVEPILPGSGFTAVLDTFQGEPKIPISTIPPNTVIFVGTGGSGSSYFTGSGSGAGTPPSTASDVRTRSFDGSDYFTSSGEVMDTSFALRLGNGVNPLAASPGGIEIVPEPSAVVLSVVAGLVFLCRRCRAKKDAN